MRWEADHNFSWDQKKVVDRENRLIPKKIKKLNILWKFLITLTKCPTCFLKYGFLLYGISIYQDWILNLIFKSILPVLILDEERKSTWIFVFTLLCGNWKGFMKSLEAFIKRGTTKRCENNILVNFYFNTTFWNERGRKS